jgi:activator of HSP90 ATPase
MVEYAVLHPKTKTMQADSLARKQQQVNMYAKQLNTAEAKQEEEKSTTIHWGDYLVMGVKAIFGFLLKLLAKF